MISLYKGLYYYSYLEMRIKQKDLRGIFRQKAKKASPQPDKRKSLLILTHLFFILDLIYIFDCSKHLPETYKYILIDQLRKNDISFCLHCLPCLLPFAFKLHSQYHFRCLNYMLFISLFVYICLIKFLYNSVLLIIRFYWLCRNNFMFMIIRCLSHTIKLIYS